MKIIGKKIALITLGMFSFSACINDGLTSLEEESSERFILALDSDEGGVSESETDYKIEIAFQDFVGDLPSADISLSYEIKDVQGMSLGSGDDELHVKEVIYEIDDCNEGELPFTFNENGTGTVTISPDVTLGMIESFEVVFNLPLETVLEDGEEEELALLDDEQLNEDDRGFVWEITDLSSTNPSIAFSSVREFEFILLDDETIATEWELDIQDQEVFDSFQSAFAPVSGPLASLSYEQVESIILEFEYEEVKIEIELTELEEDPDPCDPTDFPNKVIEIEADYSAEDGKLELEGAYLIFSEEDGQLQEELDFILKALYSIDNVAQSMTLTLQSLEDQDNFNDEAYFNSENAYQFLLTKN